MLRLQLYIPHEAVKFRQFAHYKLWPPDEKIGVI